MQTAAQPRPKAFTIDERVLERVLTINPGLRRDTVKTTAIAAADVGATTTASDAVSTVIGAFVQLKQGDLDRQLAEIAGRRVGLEQEENALKAKTRAELRQVLGVIAPALLQQRGSVVLSRFSDFLRSLDTTPHDILNRLG